MIGDELHKARTAAGLTQEQLASKARLHPTYIGLLERNKRSPSLDVFLRICDAMKVSPATLIKRILAKRQGKAAR
jgi:transcriptional regulator with XRE-family HTH domain